MDFITSLTVGVLGGFLLGTVVLAGQIAWDYIGGER